ncbi:MAG TPA: trehalose-phosphatase [Anaerolineae bacterium]|nr:trehalose-phosphatase [Anaerolineae bacterium]
MRCTPEQVLQRLIQAERRWLFLDYDGTLDEFAPTPDHVLPNPEVIELVTRLSRCPHTRVVVLSGRRLGHVLSLLPVPGVLLAGAYGIELHLPDGERLARATYDAVRPALENLKPRWAQLIAGRQGFSLEDKIWALALHARFAEAREAEAVLSVARAAATEALSAGPFRLLGGHRFLEVGPKLAHKGETVRYIFERYPWPGALSVYVGDDDKDEEAFEVIKAHGGIPILAASEPRATHADCRLESPQRVREWLSVLVEHLGPNGDSAPSERW